MREKRSPEKFNPPVEWLKQAEYDLETAKALFDAGRYIYTVFLCHLSLEKALKALYAKKFEKDPPKIHNLNYLCEKIKLQIPEDFQKFIDILNTLSLPVRYPDALERILKELKNEITEKTLNKKEELLLWLKREI